MEAILEMINQNVQFAPFIIGGLLLLAGFNLPVSEDIMIFTSAMLAAKNPDHLYPLFFGVFLGAYFSDIICYWLGRKLGPKLWQIKFFASMVKKEKVAEISNFYDKYGVLTLIMGRFIPFGVRNALFLTAGLGQMNFVKFSLSDLLACTISNILMFSLVYNYGEVVLEYVKKGNVIIFSMAAIVVVGLLLKRKKNAKSSNSKAST